MYKIEVAKPEWVQSSIKDVISSLQLIQSGRLPDSLHGAFLRTCGMRLLRCVTGDDLDTAIQVREWVLEKEEFMAKIESGEIKVEDL